ncbi:MAG: histidinol dehydrogenase [Acidobacteria bacterium]|jgi:histidinol dehydrogenase|nr:histidinol dehydrogenase [Acidobacteriota bacterium]
MKRIAYGGRDWDRWLARLPRSSAPRSPVLRATVSILRAVRTEGDRALVRLTARLDGVRLTPARLRVKPREIHALAARADRPLVEALRHMARRIEAFHRQQLQAGFRTELPDGSVLEEVVQPLASAGLYVPGGAGAYPSSVLMSAIPARVAGVGRIVVATPPRTLEANPAVAAALEIAGVVDDVFRVGGAQAVAALAYGTGSVPAVDRIVGPGNAYVTAAKRLVRGRVEIDSEAGPSEVAILADDSADAGWVAADLLAQAEHGSGDEVAVLVTWSLDLAEEVERLVAEGVRTVANASAARRALARHGAVILVKGVEDGVAAVNALAPEHVEVVTRRAERIARRIVGSAVFVGPFSPVAVGDYGVGPNHVLPTGGAARFASPLSVRDFQRRQSVVRMTEAGLARVTEDIVRVAVAEGFRGHAQSVLTRFEGE